MEIEKTCPHLSWDDIYKEMELLKEEEKLYKQNEI